MPFSFFKTPANGSMPSRTSFNGATFSSYTGSLASFAKPSSANSLLMSPRYVDSPQPSLTANR